MLEEEKQVEYYRCEVPSWADEVLYTGFKVIRKTKCGAYIDYGKPKFICERKKDIPVYKRYAWPTKKEALKSFIARKHAQLEYLDRQRRIAERGLNMANAELVNFGPKLLTDGNK